MEAGYIKLERVDTSVLPRSQKALLKRRRHLCGRLLMMRIMRVPAPRYTGFFLFRNWFRLPIFEKFRSFAGTLKRIILRGLNKPLKTNIEGERFKDSTCNEEPLMDLQESETKCKL